MSMSNLDQRLQVLIDEPRLRRIKESARREGVPVGQWVRDSIDQRLGPDSQADRIRAFMDYVASIPPVDWGGDAVDVLREAREARIDHLLEVTGETPDADGTS